MQPSHVHHARLPVAALDRSVVSVDDLDAAPARAVEAGGLRIAFVADPDGNFVELLSSDEIAEAL